MQGRQLGNKESCRCDSHKTAMIWRTGMCQTTEYKRGEGRRKEWKWESSVEGQKRGALFCHSWWTKSRKWSLLVIHDAQELRPVWLQPSKPKELVAKSSKGVTIRRNSVKPEKKTRKQLISLQRRRGRRGCSRIVEAKSSEMSACQAKFSYAFWKQANSAKVINSAKRTLCITDAWTNTAPK